MPDTKTLDQLGFLWNSQVSGLSRHEQDRNHSFSLMFLQLFSRGGVCSVYYQTPAAGGDHVTAPSGLRSRVCGNPFDRVWPPTTSGDLQPIFSCVDSRETHPLCLYVCHTREYGMWYVRGYVVGEEGVNASSSIGRNSKLEG